MRAIVHIGTEKTGSTSIQKLLFLNREKLAACGYHFLQCAGETNNRAFPSYCMREERDDDYLRGRMLETSAKKQQFRKQFRQDFDCEVSSLPSHIHTVIISSEHFHSLLLHPDEVGTLKELLDIYFSATSIIVYLRNQADTAVSFYASAIRAGHVYDLDEFLIGCDESSAYLNYDIFLSLWEDAFGRDNIDAAIFERAAFYRGNLLLDFISRIDNALADLVDADIKYENESPSYVGQLVGKAINLSFPRPEKLGQANPVRRKLIEFTYQNFKGDSEFIDSERKLELMSAFTQSNASVQHRYFPERESLFTETWCGGPALSIQNDFSEVLSELFGLLANDSAIVAPRYIDIFRDAALALEDDHPELAWELMSLAHRMRPSGALVQDKARQYAKKLGKSLEPDSG